jgi:hypothetical protein
VTASRSCFPAGCGVAETLAGASIRTFLQAHLAVARAGERSPASTPASLPEWTNLSSELERHGETPPFPSQRQRGVGGCLLDLS